MNKEMAFDMARAHGCAHHKIALFIRGKTSQDEPEKHAIKRVWNDGRSILCEVDIRGVPHSLECNYIDAYLGKTTDCELTVTTAGQKGVSA